AQEDDASPEPAAPARGRGTPVAAQDNPFQKERGTSKLPPREGMKYKYRLDKGEALLYSWKATGPVNFEFHAEPDGAPRGYAQTYEKGRGGDASGTLTAPFSGIHGWYWESAGNQPITVRLTSSGFYNMSHEFGTGSPVKNKMFP